ncbi:uncharacterized GPI-anchored protein At4g28100 [Rutidosis leptorrhynchoides]|uniref:uncharacterized GPI-anchored protein At4g28100 n=1 Tax=Rutidosis leptorrhynchoides TaxID=125765 RepID=UPI003A99E08C
MNPNAKYFPFFLLLITLMPVSPLLTDPNPVQPFHPTSSPRVNITTSTIPAQSDMSSPGECPLDLPPQFFTSVKSACTSKHKTLNPLKCCPVLAAWLYSAYSATALGKQQQTASYYNINGYEDLPLLPNDSESCVQNVENGLKSRGIELMRSNESCDVVYCECGIRLHHPLTCTESFSVNSAGDLIGNHRVKMLEKNCLNNNNNNNHNNAAANAVCSKCLNTLHLLKKVDTVNTSKVEERTSKMHNEDCELMGLTWLLAKNRSTYIHTVSAVLRATMMTTAGNTIPESCTLNSDGMPLAVDSSELNDSSSSSSIIFNSYLSLSLFSLFMLCMSIRRLFDSI